ncbi:Response regulator of zinc sigma-54-dependent two-component system [hydrothermal vent metagenome]|uniref:Response regulator of zinc sigma-54-dependent two-component system n=1 Tax=hydrothermal vent metagenome TaxID=652676 RepID=A0A3B1C4V5_9ZZZZ
MIKQKKKILIVDDDTSHRLMIKANMLDKEYDVREAEDGEDAIALVEKDFFDLIIMDIKMKKVDGITALKKIKEISPSIPVMIMTAYSSVQTAVDALKLGAAEYFVKPLDMEAVCHSVEKTFDYLELQKENKTLKEQLNRDFEISSIIGKSKAMKAVFEVISLSAPSDATILILGESGTGKELIANAIHQNSFRKEKPFVKINCAALPENLLESELFGHEKGAFTGAVTKREGRFELANEGTLFLDEIGDMTLATQAKILRVLQEGEFERVGGDKTIKADVRIIAATNKDLEKEVEEGNFRKDLFFRLSVVPITLPPLRKRKQDIPLLAEFFLKKYAEKNNRLIRGFTPAALDKLMRYDWPGNVRELENMMERTVIMSFDQLIRPETLPDLLNSAESNSNQQETELQPGRSIKDVEKELIIKTLESTDNNITRAAELLGISRRTLHNKINEYKIDL